jgi:hypothetical protein
MLVGIVKPQDTAHVGQWPRTFACTLNAQDPDAEAHYTDTLNETGWSKLYVRGNLGDSSAKFLTRLTLWDW